MMRWAVIDDNDRVIFESENPDLARQFAEGLPYQQREHADARGWDLLAPSCPRPEPR